MTEKNKTPSSEKERSRRQFLFTGLRIAASLPVFGKDDAQVLEYWLDVSLFSSWKRDAKKKLPWKRDVFLEDIAAYADRGIRHVTSFAAYMDADYVKQYGEPPLDEYGEGLRRLG